MSVYDDMFVVTGNGIGTQEGTGMHITWPIRREYIDYQDFYDEVLFDTSLPYATTDAMAWLAFLKKWYASSTPPAGGSSVCTLGVTSSVVPEPGQLLLNPSISGIFNGGHKIATEIAREADSVFVEYGIDLTSLFEERRRLGHLRESVLANKEYFRRSSNSNRPKRHRRAEGSRVSRRQRRLQDEDDLDYLLLFGGDIHGKYDQSKFNARWDRNFFLFKDANGNLETVYAFDNGGGAKEIPVLYFPSSSPIKSEEIPFGISQEDAVADLGVEYGFLSFSLVNAQDGIVPNGVSLYTFNGNTYSETPRSSGGQIVPVVYVEGTIGGVELSVLVGGFSATVMDWSETNTIDIYIATADKYLESFASDFLVVDLLAHDDDALLNPEEAGTDFYSFLLDKDGNVVTVDVDKDGKDDAASGAFSGCPIFALHALLAFACLLY
jgi:hypothetical protein